MYCVWDFEFLARRQSFKKIMTSLRGVNLEIVKSKVLLILYNAKLQPLVGAAGQQVK